MKTLASAVLLLAAFAFGRAAYAAPSAAQTDDVREAVFRALFVRAKALMPDAKVYILEKDGHHPQGWGNMSDFNPDAGVWRGAARDKHGPLVQIVSLHWLSKTSVEAETDVEAETHTDQGPPWAAVSVPYFVSLTDSKWIVTEDVRTEWRQAVQEGDVREAVVREQLAVGVYDAKPETTPCFLSFGLFSAGASADPPDTFMARFAGSPIRLRKASQHPGPGSRKPYILIGVEHVRWVSDTEAEVDSSGTCNNSLSSVSILYDVTRSASGWKVKPVLGFSV